MLATRLAVVEVAVSSEAVLALWTGIETTHHHLHRMDRACGVQYVHKFLAGNVTCQITLQLVGSYKLDEVL